MSTKHLGVRPIEENKIEEYSEESSDDSRDIHLPSKKMSTNEETKQIYQGVLKPTAKSSTTLKRYSGLFNKDTIDAPRRTSDTGGMKFHKRKQSLNLNFINYHLGGKEMFSKLGSDPNHPIKVTDQLISGCVKAFKNRIYKKGQNIIRYGDLGEEYYIIMWGVADVFVPIEEDMKFTPEEAADFRKNSSNEILFMKEKPQNPFLDETTVSVEGKREYKVKSMIFTCQITTGSGFGELALINNKPRAATVTSAGVCHVAYLNKVDFHEILSETIKEEKHERVKAIKSIPLLSKLEGAILLKVPFCVKSRKFTSGEVVYDEGDPADKIYFIEKGEFQRYRNGTLDFYGIMNPDLNSKYKISYKGIPTEFTAMKSNYMGELPKTKEITREHSKIAIITEGRAFGVTEVLLGISKRILSVKCCSDTALVNSITKHDFNIYIKKYLEEKSLMQCLLERMNLIEHSMNNILQTKMNAKQMWEANRKSINTTRTKVSENISINQRSRNIDESAINLKAQDFFPNSSTKNMNSKYSGIISHKIPFNLLKSRNITNLTISNTSPTTQNNMKSPIHGRLEPMKRKALDHKGFKRGRWSHLKHKLTDIVNSAQSKSNERIHTPQSEVVYEENKILANYMSGTNKTQANSVTRTTGLSRKYDIILEKMKNEDMSYITNVENARRVESIPHKITRSKNCKSSLRLFKERTSNKSSSPQVKTFYGQSIKRKGEKKIEYSRKKYCAEFSRTLDDLWSTVNKSCKSPASQQRVYATKHHLFRLLNLAK